MEASFCFVLRLDGIGAFASQESRGLWEGWFITGVVVIVMHLILISINNKHIIKTWRAQKAFQQSSKLMDMDEILGRCWDMLPGIHTNQNSSN